MITDSQRTLARQASTDLRAMADLIDQTVSGDPQIRMDARKAIRDDHFNSRGYLYTIDVNGHNSKTIMYDLCRKCGTEVNDTDDLCGNCGEVTVHEPRTEAV